MLPTDPLDERNIMLEIRAGTGGGEACLWAGDLLRMYQRYCLSQSWKHSIVNWGESDAGGYNYVTLEVKVWPLLATEHTVRPMLLFSPSNKKFSVDPVNVYLIHKRK